MQADLRPLGIGEILDRAVTLFVRHFSVLILIVALVAVPIAIVQYIAQPQMTGMLDELQRVLAMPPGHPQEQSAAIARVLRQNRVGQSGLGLILAAVVMGTLSSTALIIAIAQSYRGGLPSVRDVYRAAVRRWFAQLVVLIFYVALAMAIAIGIVIVMFFVALAIAALATAYRPIGPLVGIPAGLLAGLVFFVFFALIYLATQMSLVAVALEDPNPIRGVAAGLRRTLSPPVFRRSLMVAVIVFAVSGIGQLVLLAVAGGLSLATHLSALYPVIAVIGGIVLNALVSTFVVVYVFDIRVRREGYDLSLAAQEPVR